VIVNRRTGGLNDKDIGATDIFADLDKNLTIAEGPDFSGRQRLTQVPADLFSQGPISVTGEQLDFIYHGNLIFQN
jgi:hypothetical protein